MTDTLDGKKIAIIATDYFEEPELIKPQAALQDAGADVHIVSDHDGEIQAANNDVEKGQLVPVDNVIDSTDFSEYDALVLPGGTVNADNIRTNSKLKSTIRDFMDSGKLVAAICHAPWALVSAGVVDGRQLTSFPSLKDDIINAGGEWVDEEVVIEKNLITSRKPDDIPAFNNAIIKYLSA